MDDWKNDKNIAGDRCASWMDGRFLQGTFTGTRVHNDEKTAVTSVELDIPAGATVASVAPMATAKATTAKTGDHITKITWQTDIVSGKYVELAFTATNPASGQLQWIVREHFADGTTSEWSDKPGAEGKASVTKILAPAPASTPK